jgi:hypothetical protein
MPVSRCSPASARRSAGRHDRFVQCLGQVPLRLADRSRAADGFGHTPGWAAIEAVQRTPSSAGWLVATRARLTERRGRNIATTAVARRLLALVFYGLRDGHIRALDTGSPRRSGMQAA